MENSNGAVPRNPVISEQCCGTLKLVKSMVDIALWRLPRRPFMTKTMKIHMYTVTQNTLMINRMSTYAHLTL